MWDIESMTLSNGRRDHLNDEDLDAIPDSRGRGEVALLCVIGGLAVENCV